jgi:hypothetical protein
MQRQHDAAGRRNVREECRQVGQLRVLTVDGKRVQVHETLARVFAPPPVDRLPRGAHGDAMCPGPEQPRIVQRPQSPTDREQDVLEHVLGIGALIEHRPQSRREDLLRDLDQPLEMFAASGLCPQHQPRFVGRRLEGIHQRA